MSQASTTLLHDVSLFACQEDKEVPQLSCSQAGDLQAVDATETVRELQSWVILGNRVVLIGQLVPL